MNILDESRHFRDRGVIILIPIYQILFNYVIHHDFFQAVGQQHALPVIGVGHHPPGTHVTHVVVFVPFRFVILDICDIIICFGRWVIVVVLLVCFPAEVTVFQGDGDTLFDATFISFVPFLIVHAPWFALECVVGVSSIDNHGHGFRASFQGIHLTVVDSAVLPDKLEAVVILHIAEGLALRMSKLFGNSLGASTQVEEAVRRILIVVAVKDIDIFAAADEVLYVVGAATQFTALLVAGIPAQFVVVVEERAVDRAHLVAALGVEDDVGMSFVSEA